MSEAYRHAGVNLAAGYETVERIKRHVSRTMRPEVLGGLGSFGGLFALPTGYREPVLVAGTDGVGTKLKLAFAEEQHDTIGIDCVAMCVNDVVAQGAEPLFFLDYLATGKLQPQQAEAVVKGIADGCEQSGCALIGGETAEMPGMYGDGEYDIAGFCVGIVERANIVTGEHIQPGDVLIGLASSGLHSNGFSLVRQLLVDRDPDRLKRTVPWSDETWGDVLLTPTRIYVKSVLSLLKQHAIHGMAHITGGGFYENIARMLPDGTKAVIRWGEWPVPDIFTVLRQEGDLSLQEMANMFNLGIGFVLAVPEREAEAVVKSAVERGERAYPIGTVTKSGGAALVELEGEWV